MKRISSNARRCGVAATMSLAMLAAGVPAAFADSTSADGFESYVLGSPVGQGGWTAQDLGAYASSKFDQEIADATADWGTQPGMRALRISNAVTSGGYGNQLLSPSTNDEAGESEATSLGSSGGTRQARFSASMTISSADPQNAQPSLMVGISPDRGDGARMSLVRVYDTPEGLKLTLFDYGVTEEFPDGDFPEVVLAEGLERTKTHDLAFTLDFVDGLDNDVLTATLDGCQAIRIGSWEGYFRPEAQEPHSRTVDSLIVRVSATAAPDNLGKGIYLDNISTSTGASPATLPVLPKLALPAAATAVAVTGSATSAAVSFTAGASCAAVSGYTLTATPATGAPMTFTGTTSPVAATGLAFGQQYAMTVTATNSNGTSVASAPVSYTTPKAPPVMTSYINNVYSDLFGRTPDSTGMMTWSYLLSNGTPRVAVANAITYSTEFRSGLITDSYDRYLDRTPEAAGMNSWLAAMGNGWTVSQIESGFIASPEYYNAAGSDAQWVENLYDVVLDRDASTSEVTAWTTALTKGERRDQVAMGFLLSTEHLNTVVDGYYQILLGRSLDPSGQKTWVGALQAGGRDEAIIGGIIASEEYYKQN